jgi:choline kinase
MKPRHAIVLAAGQGERLRSVVPDRPKGLIEIGGEPMVARSIRMMRDEGIDRFTVVIGYRADQYRRFAAPHPDIELVVNDAFATTGSMASLACALPSVRDDLLLIESDIIYDARALPAILNAAAENATLVSGVTGAGDEVWVSASEKRVRAMSKNREGLTDVLGEFVGLTRLSSAAAEAMRKAFAQFTAAHGHGRMNYDTDALVAIAQEFSIVPVVVPDLCWGEIDDERQYERVVTKVWPSLALVGDRRP